MNAQSFINSPLLGEKIMLYRKIILLFFITLLIASCRNPSPNNSSEGPIDIPGNLPQYFDSLLTTGNYLIPYHTDSAEEVSAIVRSLTLLQDYADGKTDKYPAWAVKESLNSMILEIAYDESHGEFDIFDLMKMCITDNFFEIYMEQAIRLCPDVRLLTDRTSADGQIGILTFTNWSAHSMLTYLIYKTKEGYFNKVCWIVSDAYYNRIYQVEHEGERYYLLVDFNYNYKGDILSLVSLSENRPKECLQVIAEEVCHVVHDVLLSKDKQIIFNPKTLTWKECKKNKNGYWVEFPGSRAFRLVFGEKISIEMV